ncbi:glycosyltransferase family 69 protein [Mixia osmundae IAM 14324]|uniref:glycosyltransferase family 69 protein n=1 Tax=Mixia osmundae (strain CBS 9802 / IAM 14324 / JCM 22182 / KY 12970) TaxID=764103 RepID=UPI0004A55493|nr:glycosyltransferase family 69 protein [Mixia osmundae IAM 14324]KEI39052.1 glycosyltransferase family 69 protein [Mixia osmundae IAM 14324]
MPSNMPPLARPTRSQIKLSLTNRHASARHAGDFISFRLNKRKQLFITLAICSTVFIGLILALARGTSILRGRSGKRDPLNIASQSYGSKPVIGKKPNEPQWRTRPLKGKARSTFDALLDKSKLPSAVESRDTSAGALFDILHGLSTNKSELAICTLTPLHVQRYLKVAGSRESILIAFNARNVEAVLPSIVQELLVILDHLGSKRIHISIYENGSHDATVAQLYVLSKLFDKIDVSYTIRCDGKFVPAMDLPNRRIDSLAKIRNAALLPLTDIFVAGQNGGFDQVVFLNDVFFCAADVIELLHSRMFLDASMTCAMDYQRLEVPEFRSQGYPMLFYDVWVARDILGLPFYAIEKDGTWVLPSPPLKQNRHDHARYDSNLPFQVFSCWNGITVIQAKAFYPPHSLRFRAINHTDASSECYLFNVDLWKTGLGRIAIIPKARVAYTLREYDEVRQDLNTTAWQLSGRHIVSAREDFDWKNFPPKRVAHYDFGHWSEVAWRPPFDLD